MELLLLMDAAKRASAARITAVVPYYGYARQDRKDQPRVAISAKLVANLISQAGADRVLAIDFHQHQLQGFFDLPVDHLYAAPVFVSTTARSQFTDLVRGGPDVGSGQDGAGLRQAVERLAGDHRQAPHRGQRGGSGERGGRRRGSGLHHRDDMIDTGGTMTEAAHALKRLGAGKIYICATHALLSGPAVERLRAAPVEEVAVTNTIGSPPSGASRSSRCSRSRRCWRRRSAIPTAISR
jgi:ribose-phosphate pyrophosphokinase